MKSSRVSRPWPLQADSESSISCTVTYHLETTLMAAAQSQWCLVEKRAETPILSSTSWFDLDVVNPWVQMHISNQTVAFQAPGSMHE